MVIISDCTKHDAVAVYIFLEDFNEFLDLHFPIIRKCIYFSDGAPQQFKYLKHFANSYFHDQDFHRSADWHFQATAHGKGPCDGAVGALKRLARRASLQMPSNDQISTALELFNWARRESSLKNITILYKDTEEYTNKNKLMETRFADCRVIPGTHKLHSIKPVQNYELNVKKYSTSNEIEVFRFSKSKGKSNGTTNQKVIKKNPLRLLV